MSSFLRFLLLAVFAACGVGLAVCLATTAIQSEPVVVAVAPAAPAPPAVEAPAKPVVEPEPDKSAAPVAAEAPIEKPTSLRQPASVSNVHGAGISVASAADEAPAPIAAPPTPPQPESEPVLAIPPPPLAQKSAPPAADTEMLQKLMQIGSILADQPQTSTPGGAAKGLKALLSPTLDDPNLEGLSGTTATTGAAAGDGAEAADAGPARPSRSEIKKSATEGDNSLSIHIQDTDIREVLDMIADQGGLNILAGNSVQGKVSASLNNVDLDTALNAILKSTGFIARREGKFIFVGAAADLTAMEQAVDRIGTRVYRPNYVKSTELQTLIMPILTAGIGTVSISSPSQVGIASDQTQAGGNTFAGAEAVLVRDYEAVLVQVDQVFEEIDRRPTQVAIEAMILSVKLDDKNSFGVDFQLLRNQNNIKLASGAPLQDLGNVSFNDGGLKFGFLDSSLGAFLTALETIGDTNVIATPRLMCLNKQRAEILIGEKLGYLSTTQTETSTTQSVEFLEVGTQLRLRPFISNDGLIRMEVHPELSTGSVNVEGSFTLPNKVVTEVTTNIMVRDGCTMVIGGLMREDLGKTGNQIPLLGSAPGIGFLFRSRKDTTARNELIVLITPHIVCEPDAHREGQQAASEFHRRQAVYADNMSPIGTRYLARKYFRLSQDAWAQFDRGRALRFVDLAINFDPMNRAAIDLRSDIMSGNHLGDHSGGPPMVMAPGDGAPAMGPMPGPPMDPSQTGTVRRIEKPRHLR